MSGRGAEPFGIALGELRERLRRGVFPLDTRLAATELAAAFGLSATPVREAPSRLAGEGLLEDRRGQGFFVRRLSGGDVAALYRLHLMHLSLALEGRGGPGAGEGLDASAADDPVRRTERMFAAWVSAGGARALALSFSRLQAQLAPVRRLEPDLIEDLAQEAEGLAATQASSERLARLRLFHQRRGRVAASLAERLERGA